MLMQTRCGKRHAGANDFGGISPVTRDWVNPGSRWPHLSALAAACAARSKLLLPRLPVYPEYIHDAAKWLDPTSLPQASTRMKGCPPILQTSPALRSTAAVSAIGKTLAVADAAGYARASGWCAGMAAVPGGEAREGAADAELHRQLDVGSGAGHTTPGRSQNRKAPAVPPERRARWDVRMGTDGALDGCEGPAVTARVQAVLDKLAALPAVVTRGAAGDSLQWGGPTNSRGVGPEDVEVLLSARGASAHAVVQQADELRRAVCGDRVTYVVNRNINYTNVCTYGCAGPACNCLLLWCAVR